MNLLCRIFGHKPYQGVYTSSFYYKLMAGQRERTSQTGPAIFCTRCQKNLQPIPKLDINYYGFEGEVRAFSLKEGDE